MKKNTKPVTAASEITRACTAAKPWDAARKLKIVRHDYQPDEVIDPGVNFFVLTLEAIGAKPKYSCEGHPNGFYVLFKTSPTIAMAIGRAGYFSVELEARFGQDWWSVRVNRSFADEREKRHTLRAAARAWQAVFWRDDIADVREEIKTTVAAIAAIRADSGDIIDAMPDAATTQGQVELMRKHGTPRTFAHACINAIGEISCDEAHASIKKYKTEWDAAGSPQVPPISFDRWPLGINPEMDAHAVGHGLAHWSCVSIKSNEWWLREDGQQFQTFATKTTAGGYPEELRAFDTRNPRGA